MDWYDIEELTAEVLGFPKDEEYDSDIIEEKLAERFEIGFEQFGKIVRH
ncbi:MAG: hypothetical protein LBU43_12465 [Candidatus Accumulibacter sp.]|jgi:hypothetical protein|nr:hypothetical protein [Accumulibacter sp.]